MKAVLGVILSASVVGTPLPKEGSARTAPLPKEQPAVPVQQKPEQRSAFFADVMVLYASNSKKGIDSRIGNMPELRKPPFSAYDSYELVERTRLPLEKNARTLGLPNGRVLRTKLLDVIAEDTVKLSASINQPNGKDFLPLLEVRAKLGQAFIVAGQSYRQGILVLVIRAVR